MSFKLNNRFHAFLCLAASLLALPLLAQESTPLEAPRVPTTIYFADMTLHLTDQARRDIQADVDALYRSPKYFLMKLERVDMYLPIIEPIFAEYGIPDDLKYLVIQESALISDAVSSSNAVGFWQFKEASATEVGMRVDHQVDERMNIVASTVGAAKYLNRSNATFNNWLYSLQSYQMGLGGASRSVNKRYYGEREMKIEGNTYWYVKKFLSHLVAFRDAIGKQPRRLMLYQHKNTANRDLESIAREFNADPEQLIEYNKWLKTKRVPEDKAYVVIVPLQIDEAQNLLAGNESDRQKKDKPDQSLEDQHFGEKQKEPVVPAVPDKLVIAKVNGIKAIVARPGDNARDLAKAGDITVAKFLKFNEISPGDALKPGQVYYLKRKKNKASVYRHVLAEGESLWDVSQKYGVRINKLLQKNRLRQANAVKPGQVLWLRYIRPANEPVAYETPPKQKVAASPAAQPRQEEQKAELQAKANTGQAAQNAVRAKKENTEIPVQQQQVPASPAPQTTIAQNKEEAPQPDGSSEPQSAVNRQDAAVVSQNTDQVQRQRSEFTDKPVYTDNKQEATRQPSPAQQNREPNTSRQVVMVADTPVIKLSPQALESKNVSSDTVTSEPSSVLHIYPGAASPQRNVLEEIKENTTNPPRQATERSITSPDSFGIKGPVRFLDEEDQLAQQPPLPPAADSASTSSKIPIGEQAEMANPQPAPDSVHVVQAGETLYSISGKWNMSVQELRKRNQMGEQAVLSIGQVLKLKEDDAQAEAAPAIAEEPEDLQASIATQQDDQHVYHTVTEGETMYRVARKYNVTIKDIMEWNKKDGFSIRPGEVLVVSKKNN